MFGTSMLGGLTGFEEAFTGPPPVPVVGDPYWHYVTLLLGFGQADGTKVANGDGPVYGDTSGIVATTQLGNTQAKFGNTSLALDGDSDYVGYIDNPKWRFLANEEFTIDCWFWPDSAQTGVGGEIMTQYQATSSDRSWRLLKNSSDKLGFAWWENGVTQTDSLASTTSVTLDDWNHAAVTRDAAGNIRLFLNGVEEDSGSSTNAFHDTGGSAPLRIGAVESGGITLFFDGFIDEARICRGYCAWTDDFTPPTQPYARDNSEEAWRHTVFLCGFNGADGDAGGKAFANEVWAGWANGTCDISADQSKFGHSSLHIGTAGGAHGMRFQEEFNDSEGDRFSFGQGQAFTIEAWIYPTESSPGSNRHILGKYQPAGNERSWLFSQTTGDKLQWIQSSNGSTINVTLTTTTSLTINDWNHIAVTRDDDASGTIRLFLNGVEEDSDTYIFSILANSGVDLLLGASFTTSFALNASWQGYMDEVRITRGIARYVGNFSVPTEPFPRNFGGDTAISDPFWQSVVMRQLVQDTDFSNSAHTLTINGTPTFEGGVKPYGQASNGFDNTGTENITASDSADFDLGSGDFTLECWVYFPTDPGTNAPYFLSQWDATSNERGWRFLLRNNNLQFGYTTDGTLGDITEIDASWNPSATTWYHVAAVRDGTTVRLFVDGTQIGTGSISTDTVFNSSALFAIGAPDDTGDTLHAVNICETRITKGVARYDADGYTVPAIPMPFPGYVIHSTERLDPGLEGTDGGDRYFSDVVYLGNMAYDPPRDDSLRKREATDGGAGATQNLTDQNFGAGCREYNQATTAYDDIGGGEEFHFGTGDYTIECWVWLDTTGSNQDIITLWDATGAERGWMFRFLSSGGLLELLISTNGQVGTVTEAVTGTWSPSTSTWYHVAVSRKDGHTYLFVDGTGIDDAADTNDYWPADTTVRIGSRVTATGSNELDGRVQEVRITKGVGRYTADFTPPTGAFPRWAGNPGLRDDAFENVVLLTDMDDDPPVDESLSAHGAFTESGAISDTSNQRFGSACRDYDTSSADYDELADNTDWEFGSGDFTVECFVRFNSLTATGDILSKWGNSGDYEWLLTWDTSTDVLQWWVSTNGTTATERISQSWTPTTGVWYHIAISRVSGTTYMYIDGVLQNAGGTTDSTAYDPGNAPLHIGDRDDTSFNLAIQGKVDEVRITKGVGRYDGTNFVPPRIPFARAA